MNNPKLVHNKVLRQGFSMIVSWRVNSFKESYLMSMEDCMNPCLEGLESNWVDLAILITIK